MYDKHPLIAFHNTIITNSNLITRFEGLVGEKNEESKKQKLLQTL